MVRNTGKRPHLWIINHYAVHSDLHGRAGRHVRLAEQLVRSGWRVTIIAASTEHPSGRQLTDRRVTRLQELEGPEFVALRAPSYEGSRIRRVINMMAFTLRVLRLRDVDEPDLVLGSTVHPLAAGAAATLARRHRVPFVFEIRDLWPETLIDMGALSRNNPAALLLRWIETSTIRRSDLILSPLPGVGDYLRSRGFDVPFLWISNGVSLSEQSPPPVVERPGPVFTYFGSMGRANALTTLVEAFDLYKDAGGSRDARLRFIGSGSEREPLVRRVLESPYADSISVEEAVPQSSLPGVASASDALVANMRDLPLYKYGIALNKLFEYLSSARPVIFASSALNDPVRDADAGFSVAADDATALAGAMARLERTPLVERAAMGERGLRHVADNYDYAVLADRLGRSLLTLLEQHEEHEEPDRTTTTTKET